MRRCLGIVIALSLVLGGLAAAVVHDRGLKLWLTRHRSAEGPAGVGDGIMLGACTGMASVLFPSLTSLIATNHPEEAKAYVIVSWLSGMVLGGVAGGIVASVGKRHLDREPG